MIRVITTARLHGLEAGTLAALDCARQTGGAAGAAFGEHVREMYAFTDRLERAEATTSEVGAILSQAMKELSAAQQELLLKDIEIRRLRRELDRGPVEGESLTVLLHYGEPVAVYGSREDAHADTATHGQPAGHVWRPCGERPAAEFEWRCEAFIYDVGSNGFRRVHKSAPVVLGGAA
ncbi:hypothetical protein [Streptomyces sp. NPDC096934]|uniref:hypothetical protein n=1 Tax=Streptomyces sp. NPDC096934 TaxID=3155551 RepID=UPI003329BCE9